MDTTSTTTSKRLSNASAILGILSMFLWEFSLLPIVAIITGLLGIHASDDGEPTKEAIIGIILGTIFLIVRIANA